MIVGVYRDSFPRIVLALPSRGASLQIEFVIDTGFEGDLALPPALVRQVECVAGFDQFRALADGSKIPCPVHNFELEWNGDLRETQIVTLGGNPLLGVHLLAGCRLEMEFVEGTEVIIEFP